MATFTSENRSTSSTSGDRHGGRFKKEGLKKKGKKSYKWRRDETGGGRDCRSKQDTYKRMNASRIQYNVERAKVKVSVVFVLSTENKVSEYKRIGRPTLAPWGS